MTEGLGKVRVPFLKLREEEISEWDTCLKQSNVCPLGATVFLARLGHFVVAKREIVFSGPDSGVCVCVYVEYIFLFTCIHIKSSFKYH